MSRLYTVPYSGTLTAAGGDTDLFALRPAADKPIRLYGLRLCQTSEVGDTAEEGIRITVRRFTATVTNGSGGSAVTPVPCDDVDTAAGFTARCNDTTVATTTGTNEVKEELGWNERNTPLEIWWPEERVAPHCRLAANALIVRCETTVADDISIQITLWVEEF
jgi:hypothetical protein